MAELQEFTGLNLNRVMKIQEVILFVTSPKRVTTYHIEPRMQPAIADPGRQTHQHF